MRKHIAVAALVAAALTALSDVSYLGSATSGDAGQTRPTGLTAERLADPCGIDVPVPRLGWKVAAAKGGNGSVAVMIANVSGTEKLFSLDIGKAISLRSLCCRVTDNDNTYAIVPMPLALPPYSFIVLVLADEEDRGEI